MADWEANVRRVVPYTPGEQPKRNDIIKLNTNECPYPPAPGVTKALQEFEADKLRLYPDPAALELREAIAAAVSVSEHPVAADQVFVGVGSDDVLALAFLTFFNSKKPILFPDITYSFYDVWADLYGIPYRTPGLDERFRLMENLDTIEEIVAKNPDSVVIVDEAYVDFGGVSALPLVDKYENLLVVQTFSKSRALAGMRIGFAIGQKKLISYLNDVKFSFNSYTMNRLTIACGKACVEDRAYFQEITGKIVATREWTKQKLTELGFTFPDSKANFIFATHKTVPAQELFENLKTAGIYVRYFKKPRIDNYLRITVGTQAEMERLVEVLVELVK